MGYFAMFNDKYKVKALNDPSQTGIYLNLPIYFVSSCVKMYIYKPNDINAMLDALYTIIWNSEQYYNKSTPLWYHSHVYLFGRGYNSEL